MSGNGGLISVEITHWCPAAPGQPSRNTVTRTGRDHASAIAAWNRRAPSAEERRLRAEVGSLRAALGKQPAAEGEEPVGCPIPGMCAAVAAHAAASRAAAEAMREKAARRLASRASELRADAAYWGGPDTRHSTVRLDELGKQEAAIRALPIPTLEVEK